MTSAQKRVMAAIAATGFIGGVSKNPSRSLAVLESAGLVRYRSERTTATEAMYELTEAGKKAMEAA